MNFTELKHLKNFKKLQQNTKQGQVLWNEKQFRSLFCFANKANIVWIEMFSLSVKPRKVLQSSQHTFFLQKILINTLGLPYCSDSQATQPTAYQRVPSKLLTVWVLIKKINRWDNWCKPFSLQNYRITRVERDF